MRRHIICDRALASLVHLNGMTPAERLPAELERESLLKAILNNINDGVLTVGFDMKITSFNRAAARITGFSTEEAVGRHCSEIFCNGDVLTKKECMAQCAMKRAFLEGKPITRKKKIVNKKGEIVVISTSANILYDHNYKPIGGMSTFSDITALEKLKEECQGRKYILGNIVGMSAKMMEIYELLESISESRANVLIQGETGTGKGLVASAVHFSSIYRNGPFVHVNCAAVPENLLESELFGHVKGAFTGAFHDKQGRLELAKGGTLFLDEIGEFSPVMQAKLLKVVEEKKFERVGATKTIDVDVRIISASNKELDKAIKNGSFREDLYYRLNVIPIHVPPLRERMEDLPLLVGHFIERFNIKMQKEIKLVSSGAFDLFLKYSWPGNIRELENVLEYGFIHCREGVMDVYHLPPAFIAGCEKNTDTSIPRPLLSSIDKAPEDPELENLIKALGSCRWSRTEAAKSLNISRTTLWRMMQKYGLYE